MNSNSHNSIMILVGKKAKELLERAEQPIGNHTEAIKKAKEKLNKNREYLD